MGAIIDILLLEQAEIRLLRSHYPSCVFVNQSNTGQRIQQYRVIIPGEDQYDDSYYNFLLDNLIAMCSRNFQARFEYDESFRSRIRARADDNLRCMKAKLAEHRKAAAPPATSAFAPVTIPHHARDDEGSSRR